MDKGFFFFKYKNKSGLYLQISLTFYQLLSKRNYIFSVCLYVCGWMWVCCCFGVWRQGWGWCVVGQAVTGWSAMGDGNVKLKVVASKLVRELSLSPEESWCWQNNLAQGREEQTNPSFFSTRQLCEFSCPIEPLLYWQNSAVLLYNESAEDSRLMYSSLPKERDPVLISSLLLHCLWCSLRPCLNWGQ